MSGRFRLHKLIIRGLLAFLAAGLLFKAWQVRFIWLQPEASSAVLRVSLRGNPHDALLLSRTRDFTGLCEAASPSSAWQFFGRYTSAGDSPGDLACQAAAEIRELPAADAASVLHVSLFAPTSGYVFPELLRAFFTVSFVYGGPSDAGERLRQAMQPECHVLASVDGDSRVAGLCGFTELARTGLLAQTTLQPWAALQGDSVLLHRMNTVLRRELLLSVLPRVELDVVATAQGVVINHPPMKHTGLRLDKLLTDTKPAFTWVDWKNPDKQNFKPAVTEMVKTLEGRARLIELPYAAVASGLPLKGFPQERFSMYLPTSDWRNCGAECERMGRAVDALLEKTPWLDCSFDADVLPEVARWTSCGRNHGTYTWFLEPLDSEAAYEVMQSRMAVIKAHAQSRGSRDLKVILKLSTRYY